MLLTLPTLKSETVLSENCLSLSRRLLSTWVVKMENRHLKMPLSMKVCRVPPFPGKSKAISYRIGALQHLNKPLRRTPCLSSQARPLLYRTTALLLVSINLFLFWMIFYSQFFLDPSTSFDTASSQSQPSNLSSDVAANRAPPACLNWAKSLHCLFQDAEGVKLFRQVSKLRRFSLLLSHYLHTASKNVIKSKPSVNIRI